MSNFPMVSIICLAYNHEKYVNQTLDSLLNQQTNFPYEIIIHDDASTDSTQSILLNYKEKYPKKIKLILQRENQLSKGKDIINDFLVPKVQGKYIAICECDDFWPDSKKLQKQFDILEKEIDCGASVCRVNCVNEKGKKIDDYFPRDHFLKPGKIEGKDFISLILNTRTLNLLQFHLSGVMIRETVFKEYAEKKPQYSQIMDVGDIPLFLYCGLKGKVFYLSEAMACYRMGAIGSWNQKNSSVHKKILHLEKEIEGLRAFDSFTDRQFKKDIKLAIKKRKFIEYELKRDYQKLLSNEMKDIYKLLPKRKKIKVRLKNIFKI